MECGGRLVPLAACRTSPLVVLVRRPCEEDESEHTDRNANADACFGTDTQALVLLSYRWR